MLSPTLEVILLIIAVFFLRFIEPSADPSSSTLRHVEILFRHGDRGPAFFLPSMPNQNALWPAGPSILTNKGIVGEFMLGIWLKKHIQGFVSQNYTVKMYHIRSTFVGRTLRSGQAFSAGLFNNSESPLNNTYGRKYDPIPIYTVPEEYDILMAESPCPLGAKLKADTLETPEVLAYIAQRKAMFNTLNKYSGFNFPINHTNMWKVQDALICMKSHDYVMPCWVTPELYNQVEQTYAYIWFQEFVTNKEQTKLAFGVFMDQLIDRLQRVATSIDVPSSDRPIMAWSGHDTTVTYLLNALGLFLKPQIITYSSAVLLELHGPSYKPAPLNQFFVKVIFRNGSTDFTYQYRMLPFCTSQLSPEQGCPLDEFIEKLAWVRMSKENQTVACKLPTVNGCHLSIKAVNAITGVSVFCIFVCLTVLASYIAIYCIMPRYRARDQPASVEGQEGQEDQKQQEEKSAADPQLYP